MIVANGKAVNVSTLRNTVNMKKALVITGIIILASLFGNSAVALTVLQESFETDGSNIRYRVIGEHDDGENDYFKRGTDATIAYMAALTGEDGSFYYGGEDTDTVDGPSAGDAYPGSAAGECSVAFTNVDVSVYTNLSVTIAVAAARDYEYEIADRIMIESSFDGASWDTIGAFRGDEDFQPNQRLRLDADGTLGGEGTILTDTFQDFSFDVPDYGPNLSVRVLLLMNQGPEEAAFDNIRITGDAIPPTLSITNPPDDILVADIVTTYEVAGIANVAVRGVLSWTNGLSGNAGTVPAATGWVVAGLDLDQGINAITVTGTNLFGQSADDSVSIHRVIPPDLTITNPPADILVNNTVTAYNLKGTVTSALNVVLSWTNSLTGASSTRPLGPNWAFNGIQLDPGTNEITVSATDPVGQVDSETVIIERIIPPELTITNPPANILVNDTVATYDIQGTANHVVAGVMAWTNSLTGDSGTIPASVNWSIAGIQLGRGVNVITVTGTNRVNESADDDVTIERIAPPALMITNPPSDMLVSDGVATYDIQGTANHVVAGVMAWTNSLTGDAGTVPASTSWSIAGVPLSRGVNVISVSGTNRVNESAGDSVTIKREGTILFNEILVNPVGPDYGYDVEFIELLNTEGEGSAAGISLLLINGDSVDAGEVRNRWELGSLSFGANGLLLIGNNYDDPPLGGPWSELVSFHTAFGDPAYFGQSSVKNSSSTLLLVRNCNSSVTNNVDLDLDNDGQIDSSPWSEIIDSIAWFDGSGASDRAYSSAFFASPGRLTDAATRFQPSHVPADPEAWYFGDVMTNASDSLGRTYNTAHVSGNFPAGGYLTPGSQNYPMPEDSDADGIPDWWELLHFGGETNAVPGNDSDFDGLTDIEEYRADTNPTNSASNLGFSQMRNVGTNYIEYEYIWTNGVPQIVTQYILVVENIVLEWPSVSNKFYSLHGRTNLFADYQEIDTHLPATPPINVYTDALAPEGIFYYRIGVEPPIE